MTHQLINQPIEYKRVVRVPVLPRGRARTLREMLPQLRVQHGGDLRTTKLQVRWDWDQPLAPGQLTSTYGAVICISSYRQKTTARAADALLKVFEQVRLMGPVEDVRPALNQAGEEVATN